MAQLFSTFIELDKEAWERFEYLSKHYDYNKHFPQERLEQLRERAKELGLDTRF
jgi:hypothetical protein